MTITQDPIINDYYNQEPHERIHAFQILDGHNLLGYIWFGEYEPENAAGTLAYINADEAGQRAALYWAKQLQEQKKRGLNAIDAVLELREQPSDGDYGIIEALPVTVRSIFTLKERAELPTGLGRALDPHHDFLDRYR